MKTLAMLILVSLSLSCRAKQADGEDSRVMAVKSSSKQQRVGSHTYRVRICGPVVVKAPGIIEISLGGKGVPVIANNKRVASLLKMVDSKEELGCAYSGAMQCSPYSKEGKNQNGAFCADMFALLAPCEIREPTSGTTISNLAKPNAPLISRCDPLVESPSNLADVAAESQSLLSISDPTPAKNGGLRCPKCSSSGVISSPILNHQPSVPPGAPIVSPGSPPSGQTQIIKGKPPVAKP